MDQANQDNAGVIAPPPLMFAAPLALGILLNKLRPMAWLPQRWAKFVGLPLVVTAILFNAWFIRTMRRNRIPIDPRKSVPRVITSGPFGISRNPSYTAFAILYTGISALANSLWSILLLPLTLFAVQRGVIEREEGYLERKFGAEYTQYKSRVRRWL